MLITPDLSTIGRACMELTCSSKWMDMLKLILQVGNHFNSTNAEAFRMSTLTKLCDMKSNDNKISLLSYIKSYINERYTFLSHFYDDLINVDLARKTTDMPILQNKIANIGRGLTNISSLIQKKHGHMLAKMLHDFYFDNLDEHARAVEAHEQALEQLQTLSRLYGEDPMALTTKHTFFFENIWSFIESFKNCQTDSEADSDLDNTEESDENSFNMDAERYGTVTLRRVHRARTTNRDQRSSPISPSSPPNELPLPIPIRGTSQQQSTASPTSPPTLTPSPTQKSNTPGSVRVKKSLLGTIRGNLTQRNLHKSVANIFGDPNAEPVRAEIMNDDIQSANNHSEDNVDEEGNEKRMIKICKKINVKKKNLITPTRVFRYQGLLALCTSSCKTDYDAYLFNDLLILHCPKPDGNVDPLIQIDLDEMIVMSLPDQPNQKHCLCLQNFNGEQSVILSCYNTTSKEIWYTAFKDILDIKFFNDNWTQKINDNIEQHLTVTDDEPQSYYAYDLNTLYSDAVSEEPDGPLNIEFTNHTHEIASATLNKLLFKLAHPTEQDNNFLYTFMLTYKSFINTQDLLEFLIRRWNTPPPADVPFQTFKKTFLFPVRLRIVQILGYWVEHHYYNFREHSEILTQLTNFIAEQIKKTKMEAAADRLMLSTRSKNKQRDTFSHQQQERQKAQFQILQELIAKTDSKTANSTIITMMGTVGDGQTLPSTSTYVLPSTARGNKTILARKQSTRGNKTHRLIDLFENPDSPRSARDDFSSPREPIPKSLKESILLQFTSMDIAQQFCMIDFQSFSQIQPKECLNQAWNKSNQKRMAPNIYSMIERTNQMCDWAACEVLRCENIRDRKRALVKLIEIAEELTKLNNLNALKGIIGGLNSNAVFRLKKTWEGIDNKKLNVKDEMAALVSADKSFKLMRERVSSCLKEGSSCVVYVGAYLSDLTFIDQGNKDTINDKINFKKQKMLCSVIRNFQRLQKNPYSFPFHSCRDDLNDLSVPLNEDDMFEMSLQREARQN
ncbi:RasGEF [Acrasis kona]|uniref:RasGEF n=1 Tax=Acrasis kona TaxID=1008807 RepID=A0AAW2ZF92_9EUKA